MWRCLNLQLLEYHLGTPLLCYNNYPAVHMPCDLEVVGLNSSHLLLIYLATLLHQWSVLNQVTHGGASITVL